MTAARTIALFGGTFDPPHVCHVLASTYVLTCQDVDEIWWIPVFSHAFDSKSSISPFDERVLLCEKAIDILGPRAKVTTVEKEMGGTSRTIDTVRHLQTQYPDEHFRLVIGADILAESHLWKDFETLVKLAPPIVLGREGYQGTDAFEAGPELPNVNSGEIRSLVQKGEPFAHLVPRPVYNYIQENGLYRGEAL